MAAAKDSKSPLVGLESKSFAAGFLLCLALSVAAAIFAVFAFGQNGNAGAFSQVAQTGAGGFLQAAQTNTDACPALTPLFSPDSSDEIISLMRAAQKSIDLEMYVFTDDALARELADAEKRGVRVRVILESRVDSTASTKKIPDALSSSGAEVRWASLKYALTHSKMMIIDGKKVLVGSINFSKNAQHKNREAAVVIGGGQSDAGAVAEYSGIFEQDWKDSMEIPET